MADIKKQGQEIGRYLHGVAEFRLFENRWILWNQGDGWRRYGQLKDGVVPFEFLAKHHAAEEDKRRRCPAWAAWIDGLMEFSREERGKVGAVISALADDPDGAWSELNDCFGVEIDIEDVKFLCSAWRQSLKELDNN
jgi:hypothetical protein